MSLLSPFFVSFLVILFVLCADGIPKRKLKVLVYSPLNAWSHMQYMGKIADSLVEGGHEVHLLKFVYDPVVGAKNESKLAQKVIINEPKFTELQFLDLNNMEPIRNPFGGNGFPRIVMFDDSFKAASQIFLGICKEMVENKRLLDQLAAERYDVAIAENYDYCGFAIFHRIGVRTKVAALAVPLLQMAATHFGIPTVPSFVPCMSSPPLDSPIMSFFERFLNFYNTFYEWAYQGQRMINMEEPVIQDAFGSDFPSIGQIAKSIALEFVNSNPFLEFPRPVSNKIVHIGGLVDSKVGKLDQRFSNILERSSHGAVLVSFGSITDTTKMSASMRRAFVRSFRRFPQYEFIWKLDVISAGNDSALFASAKNVHTFEWVQQTAILRHPKLRAFISHCGQNSLSESAHSGIPIVAIPLFGDQLYNAIMAKHKGMAVHLEVREMQEEGKAEKLLVEALEKVLFSDSYRKSAQIIRKKLALTPFSAKDKLARWVEFAAEFSDLDELNLPSDLNWFAYYSIDVVLFSAFLLFFAFGISLLVLRLLLVNIPK